MDELISELKDWLNDRRGEWPSIAEESGVNLWWIYKFMGKHAPENHHSNILKKLKTYKDLSDPDQAA